MKGVTTMTYYYAQDGITIYHGDNRDVLPALPAASVDLVFTSPPYNMGTSTGAGLWSYAKPLGHYGSLRLGRRGGGTITQR